MKFSRKSGIIIPKTYSNENFYIDMKRDLTRISKDYTGVNLITLKFFVETDNELIVPRFYPVEKIGATVVDDISDGEDIKIESNIILRDTLQIDAVKFMLSNNKGIIQAQPGSGKTVVGVHVTSILKKKTLILVHRDNLVDQWIGPGEPNKPQGFLAFTNLEKDDIARLTSKTFKDDLTKSVIVTTDQTFTSLLRRNKKEFLTELYKANIGIFIADEVHTSVGAPTFAECSIWMPSKRVFGFSATPYRFDGNTDIIRHHLGEVYIAKGDATVMDARVTIILTRYGIVTSKTRKYVYWNGQLNKARYLNMLRKSERFMRLSHSLIEKFVREDRNIIYVSDRKNVLELLHNQSKTEDKSLFIESAKNDKLKSKLIFATTQKVRDGVDCKSQDCLILGSPVRNIEQLSGRIVRTDEGKKIPIIIDIVDIDEQQVRFSAKNRIKFYESKGWNVQFLRFTDDMKLEIISVEQAKKILKGE